MLRFTAVCRIFFEQCAGGVYLDELRVDEAWGSALEASVAEILKVLVVVFTKAQAYVSNRIGATSTIFLKFYARHWTALLREDMAEKVAAAKKRARYE